MMEQAEPATTTTTEPGHLPHPTPTHPTHPPTTNTFTHPPTPIHPPTNTQAHLGIVGRPRRLLLQQLGRKVHGRAHCAAVRDVAARVALRAEPKVRQLGNGEGAGTVQQHVLQLHVAAGDAHAVAVLQREEQLLEEPAALVLGDALAGGHALGEVAACGVLQRQHHVLFSQEDLRREGRVQMGGGQVRQWQWQCTGAAQGRCLCKHHAHAGMRCRRMRTSRSVTTCGCRSRMWFRTSASA